MQLVFRLALPSACALALLTGCEPNQLYLTTHTVIGVNARVNPDQSAGYLVIGYDRTFAAVMPRSVEVKDGQGKDAGTTDGTTRRVQNKEAGPTTDAMTALACSSVWVSGVTIKRYNEAIATGDAAQKFAQKLAANTADPDAKITAADRKAALKDFFGCFKEQNDDSK
jgi:hypothetical protein